MIIPKIARAVCALAALSLSACVVDATGESSEDATFGQASWDLTQAAEAEPESGDGPVGEGELGEAGDGEEQEDTVLAPPNLPIYPANTVADPHPDPWKTDHEAAEAPGNRD